MKKIKNNFHALLILLLLNIIWSVLGIYADFHWLSRVPLYLVPFTAICSLYPILLSWIYILLLIRKKPHDLILYITFIGTASYGIIAQIYFPMLMSWNGVNFHDAGSMFWVAFYGIQSIIVWNLIERVKISWLLIAVIYFVLVDCAHYFYPTFLDFLRSGYPEWLKNATVAITITIQMYFISLLVLRSCQHESFREKINKRIMLFLKTNQ